MRFWVSLEVERCFAYKILFAFIFVAIRENHFMILFIMCCRVVIGGSVNVYKDRFRREGRKLFMHSLDLIKGSVICDPVRKTEDGDSVVPFCVHTSPPVQSA